MAYALCTQVPEASTGLSSFHPTQNRLPAGEAGVQRSAEPGTAEGDMLSCVSAPGATPIRR